MAYIVEGRVALITGGVGGLGRAFAEALLEKGAKVCLSDVNRAKGRQTEEELQRRYNKERVFFHKCDVTSEKEIEGAFKQTVDRYGRLDIVCNNAGLANEKNWKLMMDVNLTAVIHGTLLAFKYMGTAAGRDDGHIINIGSAAGVLPMPFGPMYSASKHGVVGLTRSIGNISPRMFGVRVNCLCPSFTDTEIMKPTTDSYYGLDGINPTDLAPFADKMISAVGLMQPREVADCFMKLIESEKTSGGVLLATPTGKSLLQLPKTIPQMFEKHSKI